MGGTLGQAREAIGLYEQAVKTDPKFALAFVELARTWELLPHAKAAALKAVALDTNMPEAHLALAGLY